MSEPEDKREIDYDSIVTNETLLENLVSLLTTISKKRFLKTNDIKNIQDVISDIDNYKLIHCNNIDDNNEELKALKEKINDLEMALGNSEDKDLLDKYMKLTEDYKEIKMKLVDMSVQLAIEAGKNTDKSFSIDKLNTMNNYLTSRVQYLRNVISNDQDDKEENNQESVPVTEHRLKERLQFDLDSDFEELHLVFCVELLNQHIMYDSCIYKSTSLEETVSNAVEFFMSGGVSEDVYIITLLNNSVFSRFNITEAIARFTEDSLCEIETISKFIITKNICRQISKLNRKVYDKLKEIDIKES